MVWNHWQKLWGEARTRILISYVALLLFFMGVSVPAIRQILFSRVQERIERSLTQEIEEFQRLLEGRNPDTGQPFGDDAAAIFDVFLSRNIPNDDEFLLTFLNGQLYAHSPIALPTALSADSVLASFWANARVPIQETVITPEGPILYRVEPVIIGGKLLGVFVVAHTMVGEREEVQETVQVIIQVMLVVLTIATVLAWIFAGRVLTPLRLLTATARSIGESDLTQRIPIQGTGDLAELTRTFNEMMDRLQAAFASQRNFIDDASHELRTPITIIRGHLELMGSDPIEQQETRTLLLDELDRVSRFVDDLVLLAKAEQPDFLQLEIIDIQVLTQELAVKAQALGQRHWVLDQTGRGTLIGDRQRLTQAIMNLAQNASQHTQKEDTIAIGSATEQGMVRFWVRDTGDGIDAADQARIFDRFARTAKSRRRSEGAGLGLSIVRAIADAHHGRIELDSQSGKGSTFTIVLPLEFD